MDFIGNLLNEVLEGLIGFGGATLDGMLFKPSELTQGFQKVYQYFTIFGVGIALAYFIIELNKQMMFNGQNVSLKQLFVPFLKLIFAIAVCSYSTEFFSYLLKFSNDFVIFANNLSFLPTSASFDANVNYGAYINRLAFWGKVMMIIPVLLAYLITAICVLVFDYKALLYKVEFLIRIMFAPCAIADIYTGTHSNSIKYIKGTIALVLYGGCLMFVPKLVMGLAIDAAVSSFQNIALHFTDSTTALSFVIALGKVIVAPIAAVGLTGVAKQITKEAVM